MKKFFRTLITANTFVLIAIIWIVICALAVGWLAGGF